MGLWFAIDGVDDERYQRFLSEAGEPDEDDVQWYYDTVKALRAMPTAYAPMLPQIRASWEAGEFRIAREIEGLGPVFLGPFGKKGFFGPDDSAAGRGMAGGRIGAGGGFDPGNHEHVSIAEVEFRTYIYEFVGFLRQRVPGFEQAYLFMASPFLGGRASRHIVGEYIVSASDIAHEQNRFDDVIYTYRLRSDSGLPLDTATDVPYRILLPRKIDGLLVCGRGAAHGRLLRTRISCMVMGQATGTAAALCAGAEVLPRRLEVRALQRELLKAGFHLGDIDRLSELGLAAA